MLRHRTWLASALALALVAGCGDDSTDIEEASGEGEGEGEGEGPAEGEGEGEGEPVDGCTLDAGPLSEVACRRTVEIAGLSAPLQIVLTDFEVPHIYGANPADVAAGHGYIVARHRYFGMELARRNSLGELSGWFSVLALERDQLNRTLGQRVAAQRMLDRAIAPEALALLQAFSNGVNAWVDRALAGREKPPVEFALLSFGTGVPEVDLYHHWTPLDVAAIAVQLVYQEGLDRDDMRRAAALAVAEDHGLDPQGNELPARALRQAAFRHDIVGDVRPLTDIIQHTGARAKPGRAGSPLSGGLAMPRGLLGPAARFLALADRVDPPTPKGSNSWAVAGSVGEDGAALVANDPHLDFQMPTFFYQLHMDTELFGDGTDPVEIAGITVPGIPIPLVGHNRSIGWGVTRLHGDLTDIYLHTVTLTEGVPTAVLGSDGEPSALQAIDEAYAVSAFGATQPEALNCVIPRYETADGRMLIALEGEPVETPSGCGDGSAVSIAGTWVRPGDTDEDGVVSALTMDFTGLDANPIVHTVLGYIRAGSVDDFVEAQRHSVTFNNSQTVADADGRVASTGFQALPLRSYLRAEDGGWAEGGNPSLLLDGARYPGFELEIDGDRHLITDSEDPRKQAVAFDDYPRTIDPERGFVVAANNDLSGALLDNDPGNDAVYITHDYALGIRAERITERLQAYIDEGTPIGIEEMSSIQNDHRSNYAHRMLPAMLAALDSEAPGCDDEGFPDARLRLGAWAAAGHISSSGVETFYHPVVTEQELSDSVATTIFNTWTSKVLRRLLSDEHLGGVHWNRGGTFGKARLLTRMVEEPESMAGFDEASGEHVFWDDTATADTVETADEVMCRALADALDHLTGAAAGGFDDAAPEAWLWGLRHTLAMIHPLDAILGGDEVAGPLVAALSIKPLTIPVAEDLSEDDPRHGLAGYPRPGDNMAVDAAHNGWGGPDSFDYDGGPVVRFVASLSRDEVKSVAILPGGQSGDNESRAWADQARLWLGNERHPTRFEVADVVEHGTQRFVGVPLN